MSLAQYYFIPTVREGLAAYLGDEPDGRWANISAQVKPSANGEQVVEDPAYTKSIALYGPGEVLGINASVVSRTEPRENTWDYEPNYMPSVEFSEPDLPWRFTPAAAVGGKLIPWLTLIILRPEAGEYSELGERLPNDEQKNSIPLRWIQGVEVSALPDLDYAWMWAHVQVTTDPSLSDPSADTELPDALAKEISNDEPNPETHVAARIICPRRLAPKTRYIAFVVPTFKLGIEAAGLTAMGEGESPLTLSWSKDDGGPIDLPYYFKWEFGTSVRGDFESLVRLLEPRELTELGRRRMDCTSRLYDLPPCPGNDQGEEQVLELEGSLISPNLEPAKWRSADSTAAREAFQRELAKLINLPTTILTDGIETPPVVPPVFGRRHSGRPTADSGQVTDWQNDANLDPRQRAAAGYGALVVQQDQEPLMAELWDQLGDIDQANELMRHGQLGMDASKGVFNRLRTLDRAEFLWTSAPVFARTRAHLPTSVGPTTLARYINDSALPNAAFDPAFRRIARRRGGIRKRQRTVPRPTEGQDLLTRLNHGEIVAAGSPPDLVGMPSMCGVTESAISDLEKKSEPQRQAQGAFRIFGRVIDSRNRRGIGGLRIEAWDKDPAFSDMLGGATTNTRGGFRIDFDSKYFAFFFGNLGLDRYPDVYFKVFHDKTPVRVVAPKLMRNVMPGDTEISIEVEPPAGQEQTFPYRISGRVLDRATREGIPWVRVESWDKDPFVDDLVGSTKTDRNGEFHFEFERSSYREWLLDARADLYFDVYRRDTLIGTTRSGVIKNVKAGDFGNVVVEIDGPVAPLSQPGGPRIYDFCEPAVTPESLTEATSSSEWSELHKKAARSIFDALSHWLDPVAPTPEQRIPADLPAVRGVLEATVDPRIAIPARIAARVDFGPGAFQNSSLGRIESAVEFPYPMYEPLAAISQDLILPGVETVPQNTISILKTNRRFMEAYMIGLNDSLSSEALWRGAPVYLWTTFFRQFWDVEGLMDPDGDPELWKDITRLAMWPQSSALGRHQPGTDPTSAPEEQAVLLVRGDLLKRYPNTLIYAVESLSNDTPALDEYQSGIVEERLWPIFSGKLPPDLTFLGFSKSPGDLCTGGSSGKGYFVVVEERLAEPRFGFDLGNGSDPATTDSDRWWYDLTWDSLVRPSPTTGAVEENTHIDGAAPEGAAGLSPQWGSSSATVANICLQRPVRVAIHASKMLPAEVCSDE